MSNTAENNDHQAAFHRGYDCGFPDGAVAMKEAVMEQLRLLRDSSDFDTATLDYAVAIVRRLPLPEPRAGGKKG